jgi:putative transposase
MPEYLRNYVEGGKFFFTVVSYDRLPIFVSADARALLRSAWVNVQERFPFTTDALCLLPEHIHSIWTLPERDSNYTVRWREIKRLFTKGYLELIGPGQARNKSRIKRGEAAIWQRRFWEHAIRDSVDFNQHLNYLHYNPVKHGLVECVSNWPWSSFHRYVKMGYYTKDWGEAVKDDAKRMDCAE